MSSPRTHVILNPASAGGKTGKRQAQILKALERRLGGNYSLCVTKEPLEAGVSARRAITEGSELIVTIGGDGTIQEAVNGFFSDGYLINPACQLGIINSGTGGGLAQSLGLPKTIEGQLEVICNGQSRPMDVGRVIFCHENGERMERFFVNECQAGIGGAVVKRVGSKQKWVGGRLAFGSGALKMALRHQAQPMTVVIDRAFEITEPLIGVVIANGAYTGGGMNLAPRASVDDGFLDILLIHEQSKSQRLWNFPKIYLGRHIPSPKFSYYQAKQITVTSSESVPLEADGELLGSLPCTVDVLPAALGVRSFS